jgi:hypothetical protein
MKLINDAKSAWKLLSVHVAGVAIAWAMLPADQQAAILAVVGIGQERVTAVLGVLFIVARLIKQTPDAEGK